MCVAWILSATMRHPAAEQRVTALLSALQPSPASEARRLAIAHLICSIIRKCFHNEYEVRFIATRDGARVEVATSHSCFWRTPVTNPHHANSMPGGGLPLRICPSAHLPPRW